MLRHFPAGKARWLLTLPGRRVSWAVSLVRMCEAQLDGELMVPELMWIVERTEGACRRWQCR